MINQYLQQIISRRDENVVWLKVSNYRNLLTVTLTVIIMGSRVVGHSITVIIYKDFHD